MPVMGVVQPLREFESVLKPAPQKAVGPLTVENIALDPLTILANDKWKGKKGKDILFDPSLIDKIYKDEFTGVDVASRGIYIYMYIYVMI